MNFDYMKLARKYQKITAVVLTFIMVVTLGLTGWYFEPQAAGGSSWTSSGELSIKDDPLLRETGEADFQVRYATSSDASPSDASPSNVTFTAKIGNDSDLEFYSGTNGKYATITVTNELEGKEQIVSRSDYTADVEKENEELSITLTGLNAIKGTNTVDIQIHTRLRGGTVAKDAILNNDRDYDLWVGQQGVSDNVTATVTRLVLNSSEAEASSMDFYQLITSHNGAIVDTKEQYTTIIEQEGITSESIDPTKDFSVIFKASPSNLKLPVDMEFEQIYRIEDIFGSDKIPPIVLKEDRTIIVEGTLPQGESIRLGEAYWDISGDCILLRLDNADIIKNYPQYSKLNLNDFKNLKISFICEFDELSSGGETETEYSFNNGFTFKFSLDGIDGTAGKLEKSDGTLVGTDIVQWNIKYVHPLEPGDKTSVTFTDTLPKELDYVYGTISNESEASYTVVSTESNADGVTEVIYTLSNLEPGATVEITMSTQIKSSVLEAWIGYEKVVDNTVTTEEWNGLTDGGSFYTKGTWIAKKSILKTGTYSAVDNSISWTVTLRSLPDNTESLASLHFIDLLAPALTLDESSLKVNGIAVSSNGGFVKPYPSNYYVGVEGAPEALANYEAKDGTLWGITNLKEYPLSSSNEYRITYKTTINTGVYNDLAKDDIINKAWIRWTYGNEGIGPGNGVERVFWDEVGVAKASVELSGFGKTAESQNFGSGIFQWTLKMPNYAGATDSKIVIQDTTAIYNYYKKDNGSYGNANTTRPNDDNWWEKLHSFVDLESINSTTSDTTINAQIESTETDYEDQLKKMLDPNGAMAELSVNVEIWPKYQSTSDKTVFTYFSAASSSMNYDFVSTQPEATTGALEAVGTNLEIVIEGYERNGDLGNQIQIPCVTYANYEHVDADRPFHQYNNNDMFTTYPYPSDPRSNISTYNEIRYYNWARIYYYTDKNSGIQAVESALATIDRNLAKKSAASYEIMEIDGKETPVITWDVTLYTQAGKEAEFHIQDFIPEGLKFLKATDEQGNNLPVTSTIENNEEKVSLSVDVGNSTRTIKIFTEVTNVDYKGDAPLAFTNKALFTLGGLTWGSEAYFELSENNIYKWGSKDLDAATNKLNYSVLVNPFEIELLPNVTEDKELFVIDQSNTKLDITLATITPITVTGGFELQNITSFGTQGFTTNKEYGVDASKLDYIKTGDSINLLDLQNKEFFVYSYDATTDTHSYQVDLIGLGLSSNEAYIFEYAAIPRDEEGNLKTTGSITNKAILTGTGIQIVETEDNESEANLVGGGSADSDAPLHLYLKKLDGVSSELLPGAEFSYAVIGVPIGTEPVVGATYDTYASGEGYVTNSLGSATIEIDDWSTINGNIMDENLNAWFEFTEVIAPKGYKNPSEKIYVSIDDLVKNNGVDGEYLSYQYEIANDPIDFMFNFKKISSEIKTLGLPKATFELYFMQEENVVSVSDALKDKLSDTTDKDGLATISFTYSDVKEYVSANTPLEVWYRETTAPIGYIGNLQGVKLGTITIDENGTLLFDEEEIEGTLDVLSEVANTPKSYGFTINKYKVSNLEDTSEPLDGVTFKAFVNDSDPSTPPVLVGDGVTENGTLSISFTYDDLRSLKGEIFQVYIEETPLPGYDLQESISIGTIESGIFEPSSNMNGNNIVEVNNYLNRYGFNFNKRHGSENGEVLEDAIFRIYVDGVAVLDSDPTDIYGNTSLEFEYNDTWFTDNVESVQIEYEEIQAPDGHKLSGERKLLATIYKDGRIESENLEGIVVINEYMDYEFYFNKYDSSSNESLEGAVFEIYVEEKEGNETPIFLATASNSVENKESSTHSIAFDYGLLEELLPNFSTAIVSIKEVEAPAGYLLDSSLKPFAQITSDGTARHLTEEIEIIEDVIQIKNDPLNYEFNFTKLDGLTEELLSGAEFELYFKAENGDKVWVGKNSQLSETPVTIDTNDNFWTFTESETGKFSVTFDYVDLASRGLLGQSIYFSEVKAPAGYILDSEERILGHLNLDGTFEESEFVVENPQIPNKFDTVIYNYKEQIIQIVKVDSANVDTTLVGAEFEVYFVDENNQTTWITQEGTLSQVQSAWITAGNGLAKAEINEMTHLDTIRGKVIYFRELVAPEGYQLESGEVALYYVLNEDGDWVEITFDENGEWSYTDTILEGNEITVTVLNTLIPPTPTESDGDGGGSSGGGGGSSEPPVTTITIGDSPVPLASTVPPAIAPIVETIEDLGVPLAGFLPKTGYEDAMLLYALGALLTAGAAIALQIRAVKRKKKK